MSSLTHLPSRLPKLLPRRIGWTLPVPLPRHLSTTTSSSSSDQVRIMEVGGRDGLQNEKQTIPTETKVDFLRRLAKTGVRDIEAGSFVSSKWVPQMANTRDVLLSLRRSPIPSAQPIAFNYLIPNQKGLEHMLDAMESSSPPSPDANPPTSTPTEDISISIFTAATDSFSKANTNTTVADSLARFAPLLDTARDRLPPTLRVRAYISAALGCPYDGADAVDAPGVARLAASLLEMGVDEVSLGDTTGTGTAGRTARLLRALGEAGVASQDVAMHFHDTYGQALVNTVVALEHGVRVFDSSVAGLGGCPYARGATGNVATEDLVYTLHSLGMRTGVDLEEMALVGAWISERLGRENGSRVGKAVLAKRQRGA